MSSDEHDEPDARAFGLTRDYRRKPEVEAEIRSLRKLADDRLVSVAENAQAIETIIHAARRLRRAGRDEDAAALEEVLLRRADHVVALAARRQFPSSPANREDAVQEVALQVWQAVRDCSPKGEFW